MKHLLLEPYSGISGDMFLGALAPLLNAEHDLETLPARLGLKEVDVRFSDVTRSTIRCRKATVTVRGQAPEGDDHDHVHGHTHHHHGQGHGHTHHTHTHGHTHRAYTDIVRVIREADLPRGARDLALDMFRALGEAEAEMHGTSLEKVHFHEVGGEDALIDIVGAALLIDRLSPDTVYATPVCVGSGYVRTAHGRLPVPAPATQHLLRGMPTFPGPVEKEMTTPTGALILKALRPCFDRPPLSISATALGAGTRDLDQPNALRASLCEGPATDGEAIVLLQTNLDNVSSEDLGADLLSDLLEAGALDAWITPVVMKKGRPGHLLDVLSHPANAEALRQWILNSLPTLGVRRFDGNRRILPRETGRVKTPVGTVTAKRHRLPDGSSRILPEYESLRKAARKAGVPVNRLRHPASETDET